MNEQHIEQEFVKTLVWFAGLLLAAKVFWFLWGSNMNAEIVVYVDYDAPTLTVDNDIEDYPSEAHVADDDCHAWDKWYESEVIRLRWFREGKWYEQWVGGYYWIEGNKDDGYEAHKEDEGEVVGGWRNSNSSDYGEIEEIEPPTDLTAADVEKYSVDADTAQDDVADVVISENYISLPKATLEFICECGTVMPYEQWLRDDGNCTTCLDVNMEVEDDELESSGTKKGSSKKSH